MKRRLLLSASALALAAQGGAFGAVITTGPGGAPLRISPSGGVLSSTGLVPPVSSAVLIQSFGLANWSASASAGFARRGVIFKKGDVPAGTSVTAKIGAAVIAADRKSVV